METFWYAAVTLMLTTYVALDGYDLGVGMLVPFVAKQETERRIIRATIGPVWTGNEVWLIAGSAVLFLAFPKAYAAGFSGFYLALMILLWLLIGRGLAFELREHVDHPLWRRFWDATFSAASLLLAFVLGLLIGNVIRGVPLNAHGYFFLPLWTDFRPGSLPGILDWFTLLTGCIMVVLLVLHGATYLAMKTLGPLRAKGRSLARHATVVVAVFLASFLAVAPFVQTAFRTNYEAHPIGYAWSLASLAALVALRLFHARHRQVAAFASSSLLVASLLMAIAWGTYPNLLIATTDPANNVTITNASAASEGLQAALWWLLPGLACVALYQIHIHRMFGCPVSPESQQQPESVK